MNLCLGTVQFGMDYGIRRQKKPSLAESIDMLDYAAQNGVTRLDTAYAYGEAEAVVGAFLKKSTIPRANLFISAKLKPNIMDGVARDSIYKVARKNLEESFRRMGIDYLDAYMCHSSRYAYDDSILEAMVRLKDEGWVRHVGVSVYEVDEAKKCLSDVRLDYMQLPFSVLDQRMADGGVFESCDPDRVTIDSRSAFIQGLVLMTVDEIPPFLSRAYPIIQKLDTLCNCHGLSRTELALGFVKRVHGISNLVFGVDNLSQLKEDIDIFNRIELSSEVILDVGKVFRDLPADIVMPSLWKKD